MAPVSSSKRHVFFSCKEEKKPCKSVWRRGKTRAPQSRLDKHTQRRRRLRDPSDFQQSHDAAEAALFLLLLLRVIVGRRVFGRRNLGDILAL